MADDRTYIRVHDGLDEHPKVEPLSDGAFRLLLTCWFYCSRNRTDGQIAAAVWKKRGTAKTRRELIDAGLGDSKAFAGSKAEGVTVELAPGELVESNVAALEGAKVGETREVDYTFPADYRVEDVKGKAAHFKFHVKGLKKKVIPEFNDDFAKETGAAQTLEELRTKTRTDLEQGKKNRALGEERAALIGALIEKNPFEVPRAMVERTIDQMLETRLRTMQRMGMDPRQLNLDFARLREELREEALREVKGALLFEAIALSQGIQTSDEDLERKIAELAQEANQSVDVVRKYFKGPDERQGLSLRLREEKTIEFLKGRAKYS